LKPSGALLIDKPEGLTSQDVVTKIKWAFVNQGYAERGFKIGHGGTLDPFATGVLAVLFGEATKLADCYLHSHKAYSGIIFLGKQTLTGDLTGETSLEKAVPELSEEAWQKLAHAFTLKDYLQIPPMFSAKKRDGKALYELARAGIEVERDAILKKITEFTVRLISKNELTFHAECESGTYVRVLAEDLAISAGTVAHLSALRRTRSSDFTIHKCAVLTETLKALEEKQPLETLPNFVPLSGVASHIPSLSVEMDVVEGLKQGQKRVLDPLLKEMKACFPQSRYGIIRYNQSPIALMEQAENASQFRLQRILN
jgi:tRNA pseudouridine55 synthase